MADTTVPTQVVQNQVGFAPELAPYGQNLLGTAASTVYQYQKDDKGQNVLDEKGMPIISGFQPYQAYTGERTAQFTPLQLQSFQGAQGMQPSALMGSAANLASQAGLGALNTQYDTSNYQNQSFTQPGAAQNYMNPYQQGVVDIQKREAQRQADIAGTKSGAQAAAAGAFGGSRQAIQNAEAQRNLNTQMGDIQAAGSNAAYTQAMNQFNTEQQARQQAAQLNEQSSQFGAGLGLQGLQTALTSANTQGTLGQNQFQQGMDVNKLQNQYGTQQQNQMNTILGNQYQSYLDKLNYPYKQLGFMSDILRGAPMSQTGSNVFNQPPSTTSQLAGLATAGAGAYKLATGKTGGSTKDIQRRGAGLADLAIARMA